MPEEVKALIVFIVYEDRVSFFLKEFRRDLIRIVFS